MSSKLTLVPTKGCALRKEDACTTVSLRDYNSVAALKSDQLKKLCLANNIDIHFPKKARIILLCHVLGISTTGNIQPRNYSTDISNCLTVEQKRELSRLTPAYMCQLKDWKKDLSSIPDIEESVIKKYLINTDVLKKIDSRTYKISRPYALQQFVHSIWYCDNMSAEHFVVIRAQCNPSQSGNQEEIKVVYVILEKYLGEPYGGFCTCTVGNSERCGHIGAVLFKLAELQATGASEGPSCTEVLCKWADPKGCKAEPTEFDKLSIRKNDLPIRRTVGDYGQKVTNRLPPPSYDDVVELRASLIEATYHIGQYCPAVHILNCDRFKSDNENPAVKAVSNLPDTLEYDSDVIAPSKEIEIKTTPVSIPQLVKQQFGTVTDRGYEAACKQLFVKATDMNLNVEEIDQITRGQAGNPVWHDQRMAAITATKFDKVIKITEKNSSAENVLKEMLDTRTDKLKNVPAIKWGRKNESKARQMYMKETAHHHKNYCMEEHGLLIHKACNFIRGSPDGIMTCDCHGRTLVEIKCPWNARMMSVSEGVTCGKIKFLEKVNSHFKLKESSQDGYFAQIQGLMGIANIQMCHLVVYTSCGIEIIKVPYNPGFFVEKLVPACKNFFRMHLIPRLLLSERPAETVKTSVPFCAADTSVPGLVEAPVPVCDTDTSVPGLVEVPVPVCDIDTSVPGLVKAPVPVCDIDTSVPEYIATPLSTPLDQPKHRKRKRVTTPKAPKSMSASKQSTSPQLVLPQMSATSANKATTFAQLILAENAEYKCASCKKILPEDNIAANNSNASVGCDCPNCDGCDVWMCWPCARYDQEWADSGDNWYCPECTRECDIVY